VGQNNLSLEEQQQPVLDPPSPSGRSLDAGNLIGPNKSNANLGALLRSLSFSAHWNQFFLTPLSL